LSTCAASPYSEVEFALQAGAASPHHAPLRSSAFGACFSLKAGAESHSLHHATLKLFKVFSQAPSALRAALWILKKNLYK
jgi:hypothetical protein